MAVIAVAGGTGGVGRTIVEKLVQEPKFQVVVLSRVRSTREPDEEQYVNLNIDTETRTKLNSPTCADRLR